MLLHAFLSQLILTKLTPLSSVFVANLDYVFASWAVHYVISSSTLLLVVAAQENLWCDSFNFLLQSFP